MTAAARTRSRLSPCPRAGTGVHAWLFSRALQLHHDTPTGRIIQILAEETRGCGRAVTAREIADAVANAARRFQPRQGQGFTPTPQPRKWPERDPKRIDELTRDGGGLPDLWEASPVRMDEDAPDADGIVDALFPGNPLVCCCGKEKWEFDTRPREDWRGQLARLQFITPSPMSSITGLTQDGKESAHTLNNTGPRRYLVIEQDQGTVDEQALILLHLRKFGHLVLVVHSGGKSLHGWFFVADWPEEKQWKFFRYACAVGADPATWPKLQFVRMPGGTRADGRRQTVYYFNPAPLCRP